MDGDPGFVLRRQGHPVVQEVTTAQEECLHSVFAYMSDPVEGNRAVVSPDAHHIRNVPAVRERSMEVRGQLVQVSQLRVLNELNHRLQNFPVLIRRWPGLSR